MNQFTRIKCLGKGTFGSAILVKDKAGKKFVVKEIDISKMPRSEKLAAEQEAKVLKSLKHPNIVSCTDSFTDGGKLCIVMDYCDGGDLYETLTKQKSVLLGEEVILDWFVQLCLAMKHVHDRKILHRDLKAQNIFMSAGGRMLKVGDFGVAKVLEGTMQLAHTAVGTPYYLSPEICQGKPYNHKSDIWSLGCVLYELATLKHPFDASTLKLLVLKIIKGNYPPVPPKYSSDLRSLIGSMITKDPKKRPSINDILKLPFLRSRINSFLTEDKLAEEFSHTVLHGQRGLNKVVPGQGRGGGMIPKPKGQGAGGVALPMGGAPKRAAAAPQSTSAAPKPSNNDAIGTRAVQEAKRQAEYMAAERRAREAAQRESAAMAARRRQEEVEHQRNADLARRAKERAEENARLEDQRKESERRMMMEAEQRAEEEKNRIMEKKAREAARREDERRHADLAKREFIARQAEAARNRDRYNNNGNDNDVEIYVPEAGPSRPEPSYGGRMVYASPSKAGAAAARPSNAALSDEERRRIFFEQKEAAARNRQQAESRPPESDEAEGLPEVDPYEDEVLPYEDEERPMPQKPTDQEIDPNDRRAAFFEMRAAAERNRQQVMGDVAPLLHIPGSAAPPPADPPAHRADDVLPYDDTFDPTTLADDDQDAEEMPHDLYTISEQESGEFAAMVENMRDFMVTIDEGVPLEDDGPEDAAQAELEALKAEAIAEGDDDAVARAMSAPLSCLAGKFVLDGNTLVLPNIGGPEEETLPSRVEALREFLEKELGDDTFIKSYRIMAEVVSKADSDEDSAVHDIMKLIGQDRVGFISLIHQLLVCEDSMMAVNK